MWWEVRWRQVSPSQSVIWVKDGVSNVLGIDTGFSIQELQKPNPI